MKPAIYTIGSHSISFSLESIRSRYSQKEDFVKDVSKANEHLDKELLTKVLDKIWNEVFPSEESDREDQQTTNEAKPSRKAKTNQEGAE